MRRASTSTISSTARSSSWSIPAATSVGSSASTAAGRRRPRDGTQLRRLAPPDGGSPRAPVQALPRLGGRPADRGAHPAPRSRARRRGRLLRPRAPRLQRGAHRPAGRRGARGHRLAGAPHVEDAGRDELIDLDAAALAEAAAGPGFVAGLELAEALHAEVVEPLLRDRLPGLAYGAALLGSGSEVLGFDTPVSTDHDWGPRFQLFLQPEDRDRHAATIHELLRHALPTEFRGHATSFGAPDELGVRLPAPRGDGPV